MSVPRTPGRPRAAFARLRAEHRRALAALERFTGARRASRRGPLDEQPFRALARYLAGAFTVQLAAEDGVLYPALARELPELTLTLEPLRADHAELGDMARGLATLLALPRTPRRDEQLGVLGHDIVDLLRLHLEKEERLVLGWSERALPAPVQRDLQRRMGRILGPVVRLVPGPAPRRKRLRTR